MKQPKYEYYIEILFCKNSNLQLPLSFGMRKYGSGKEVADLVAWQVLAVNGNRLLGLHGRLGWERMRSNHVPVSGTMAGEAGIKVWDACSAVETQTFYILPVVTPSELTFSFSWEGIQSQVPSRHCFASSYSVCCQKKQVCVCHGRSIFIKAKMLKLCVFPQFKC